MGGPQPTQGTRMRIRTIKPEFFVHEALYVAEDETKLPVRLAFAGLWCAADREGRFKWEPRRLGVQILPYDGIDFSRVLDALTTRGFVVRYAVKGVSYGLIPSFLKHQVINNRERPSELPSPESSEAISLGIPREEDASTTGEPREEHACKEEGKGKEGKGTIAADGGENGSQAENPEKPDTVPRQGELLDPPPKPPKQPPAPRPRKCDQLSEELVEATGGNILCLTDTGRGAANKAMSEIRKATPDVTADDIRGAAFNYKKLFPNSTPTPMAIAKHWSTIVPSPESDLKDEIDSHPANRKRIGYVESEVTEEQKADLTSKWEQYKKLKEAP